MTEVGEDREEEEEEEALIQKGNFQSNEGGKWTFGLFFFPYKLNKF